MTVRSHLPWPLRWVLLALMLGFSAALALWAFELGRSLAGLSRPVTQQVRPDEVEALRAEIARLREERDKAQSIANTAESLLKSERVAQERLAAQIKALETENLALKGDLGFFERLLPASGRDPVSVRALQAEVEAPGRLRYQLLVMQAGKALPQFQGRYELTLVGTLEGRPWTFPMPGGPQPLALKQYLRVEGVIDFPQGAVIKQAQVRVTDARGEVRALQSVRL